MMPLSGLGLASVVVVAVVIVTVAVGVVGILIDGSVTRHEGEGSR